MAWERLENHIGDILRALAGRRGRKTRFLVDEDVEADLRRRIGKKYNLVSATDFGLRSDSEVYSVARDQGRMLLTRDHDFLNDRNFPPAGHPGVIVLGSGFDVDRGLKVLNGLFGRFAENWPGVKVLIEGDGHFAIWESSEDSTRTKNRYRLANEAVEIWVDT